VAFSPAVQGALDVGIRDMVGYATIRSITQLSAVNAVAMVRDPSLLPSVSVPGPRESRDEALSCITFTRVLLWISEQSYARLGQPWRRADDQPGRHAARESVVTELRFELSGPARTRRDPLKLDLGRPRAESGPYLSGWLAGGRSVETLMDAPREERSLRSASRTVRSYVSRLR
jgi:hypothetical protein